eukprot:SAG11_NODE_313_length_10878_cov_43.354578_4_plen_72_part_00
MSVESMRPLAQYANEPILRGLVMDVEQEIMRCHVDCEPEDFFGTLFCDNSDFTSQVSAASMVHYFAAGLPQ